MHACHERRVLGPYLLGQLGPTERARLERHLKSCPSCRAEITAMAPLPGLLHHTRYERPGPGPGMRELTGRPTRPSPGRAGPRSRRLVAAGALAASAILLGAGLLLTASPTATPSAAQVTSTATDATTGVQAAALLHTEATGTDITLNVRGLPPAIVCHLLVRGPGGRLQTAATWASHYTRTATVEGTSAWPVSQIADLRIVTGTDRLLVDLPIPAARGTPSAR